MMRTLLSLPQCMSRELPEVLPHCMVSHALADPPGQWLGSGGATANLLVDAWSQSSTRVSFQHWLEQNPTLVIHAGGKSRRLPAYAPSGKIFAPIPVFRWSTGQRLTQTLFDLQYDQLSSLLQRAPEGSRIMIASGDVLIRFPKRMPPLPEADVIIFGLWIRPEEASNFGVLFCHRSDPTSLDFFLQKPSPEQIREYAGQYLYMVDTGIWILSSRAVQVLMNRSGWNAQSQSFGPQGPLPYELYAQFGLSLGRNPAGSDADIQELTCAAVPLPHGEFYHFGKTSDLIHSSSALQNIILDQTKLGLASAVPHPDQYLQNARVESHPDAGQHTLWIENACIPSSWRLHHHHVLTGIPDNNWNLDLPPGICIDCVPIGDRDIALRPYGIEDLFRGGIDDPETLWMGKPLIEWFEQRGLSTSDLDSSPCADIQEAPLFPVVDPNQDLGPLIQWMISPTAAGESCHSAQASWTSARKLSASQLTTEINVQRLFRSRQERAVEAIPKLLQNHAKSIFFNLDLDECARIFAHSQLELPTEIPPPKDVQVLKQSRFAMFSASVMRHRNMQGRQAREKEAFAVLREGIVNLVQQSPVHPVSNLIEDQIIAARSPVRLDLAGGWTDTPPYCLQFGGQVVNLAVDLNGQPPIQVFIKIRKTPDIVIRSIDLGTENRLATFEDIQRYNDVGSGFTIARAALALAGFHPDFCIRPGYPSLREQLTEFGGGLEISLLAAIPKGSGLGTSSILAGTLLGALNDLCSLQWSTSDLIMRTLALEQLLTTGGGWQDQAGALFPGIKLLRTRPGLDQAPNVQWLPSHGIHSECSSDRIMLFYTGITRVAKNILQDIVRGMFLNSGRRLRILEEIGQNAVFTGQAIQENRWDQLVEAIQTSWRLNQALDGGTNPPEIQAIIDRIEADTDALKLLGAGGGGYMLILAKDARAGVRIRQKLTRTPPNPRSRFVDIELNTQGMVLARS
jgi:galactokinase/mevalonate kinase-like predicted kinase